MIAETLNKSDKISSIYKVITAREQKNILLEKNNLLASLDFEIALNQSWITHELTISAE